MNKEDEKTLGTLAGLTFVLSPEEYTKYKKSLNEQIEEKDKEIERLNNIINELEESIQKEIDRTNKLILEDASMIEINNIRKMLNDTRQCILFKLKELKGNNND